MTQKAQRIRPKPPSGPARGAGKAVSLLDRAIEAQTAGDLKSAKGFYYKQLAARPDDDRSWTNLGGILRREGRREAALAAQRRAHALAPDRLPVRHNFANALDDCGLHDEAAALRRGLLRENPDNPEITQLLVRSLRSSGAEAEALEIALAARQRFSDHAMLGLETAVTQLLMGDYAAGFERYAARWETDKVTRPKTSLPHWTGGDISGKRVLVMYEQGFGDTINFLRYLPHLGELGARVSFLSKGPTERLLSGLSGAETVVTGSPPVRDFDCWASILDIPAAYHRTHSEVPPPIPLHLPDDSRARAREIVRPHADRFKVGVVWSGSATNERNAMRSCHHRKFLRLADIEGVQLFSLYKGPFLARYHADGTAAFVIDAASDDRDLADCAAMIDQMDLVITIDTVTAHIAGSLGKEVWTLLHWEPFWLYGSSGDTTPWYPTMRLYRQSVPDDWDELFARLRVDLAKRTGTGEKAG